MDHHEKTVRSGEKAGVKDGVGERLSHFVQEIVVSFPRKGGQGRKWFTVVSFS
jgi:hypothetical protein